MDLIRIGAFELYPSERMLCAAGEPVDRLHPLVFEGARVQADP